MSGKSAGTLLFAAAVVGTGGAALAAVPALAGTAAVAGGAAATAGAIGTGGAIAGLTAGTLATIGTLGSVGMSVLSGIQGKEAADFERAQIETQQRQEDVKASQDRARRERSLSDILSSQRAIFGARGVSLGSGVASTAESASVSESNREGSIAALNTATNKSSLALSSSQLAKEGRAAVTGGLVRSASLLSTIK